MTFVDVDQRQRLLQEAMDEYGDYLVKVCYTYVRNWQTAEDLAQDSFIKYYRALPKFRNESSVKTYLFRIAVNVCHDYLASWKYKKVIISNSFQKLLHTEKTTEQLVLQQNEEEMLVQAIERLSPKYKDVIVLFHFIDMSLEEVSMTLKLPVNTVKTRLRRARQMIGLSLQEEGGTYGPNT